MIDVMRGLIACLLLLGFEAAEAQGIHLIAPGSSAQGPVSPIAMTRRVEAAARRYERYAPVPRFAVYDVAYPRDAAEYSATGGFGVALVVVYTQQAAELPLRRLSLRTGNNTVALELMSAASSSVDTASDAGRVFGGHRWEALYRYPSFRQQAGSELVADFQANRSDFVLARFTAPGVDETPGADNGAIAARQPDRSAILALIAREYPGFVVSEAPAPAAGDRRTP